MLIGPKVALAGTPPSVLVEQRAPTAGSPDTALVHMPKHKVQDLPSHGLT